MIIDQLVLGAYENNCYVLRKELESVDCLIVDTGLDVEPLIDFLNKHKLNPIAVICTHGHADHIAGIAQLRDEYPSIKVVIHKNDAEMLTRAELNLSMLANVKISAGQADIVIEGEGRMSFAGLEFEILETPGHSPGGVCYYFEDENAAFSGDTLFASSIGRTDFPGYDQERCFNQLINSIKSKILKLADNTKVYPGHGPVTTVEHERYNNPYLLEK